MAFAEALQIAREKDVDFILLGGDLFHVNKPSTNVEHKCMKIIRQHMNASESSTQAITTLKTTTFCRIKGELSHFERLKHANFEDPNMIVQYPLFTIHGNHDDPTGPQVKSACEKLATCGLLNYFGLVKPGTDKKMHIEPIVLVKGSIKIALYGIGFIPDRKFRLAIEQGNVIFEKPAEDTFNVLVVHQNRVGFDKSKYIPDEMFPKFFHLIIRGHEHTAQAPKKIPDSKVDGIVYQPGSTVATSISTMEAGAKRVGLMTVKLKASTGGDDSSPQSRYSLDYELIELKCCRTMIFKDITQKEVFIYIKSMDNRKKLTPIEYKSIFRQFVIDRIGQLLATFKKEANESTQIIPSSEKSTHESSSTRTNDISIYDKLHRFQLPLMRIRLEYVSKAERFDEDDVSSLFYPMQVANRDIVKFKEQKIVMNPEGQPENVTFKEEFEDDDDMDDFDVVNLAEERKDTIESTIESYFEDKPAKDGLKLLSMSTYIDAVRGAQEDGNVIAKVLKKKQSEVLMNYDKSKALKAEETAGGSFHEESYIEEWLINEFQGSNQMCSKEGCAQDKLVKVEVVAEDDDDDDIQWED